MPGMGSPRLSAFVCFTKGTLEVGNSRSCIRLNGLDGCLRLGLALTDGGLSLGDHLRFFSSGTMLMSVHDGFQLGRFLR